MTTYVVSRLAYIASYDVTQLTKGVMTTRQMFNQQKKILEATQTPLERYNNGLHNLRLLSSKYPEVLKRQKLVQGQLNMQYLEAEAKIRKLTQAENARLETLRMTAKQEALNNQQAAKSPAGGPSAADGAGAGSGGGGMPMMLKTSLAGGVLGKLGYAGLAKGAGLIGLAASVGKFVADGWKEVPMFADLQRNTAALEVFTGSLEKAEKLTDRLRKLSMQTGGQLSMYQDSAATMAGYGVEIDVSAKRLEQFSAIARGNSERIRSMSLAYGQVQAAGRLLGGELLQLINAGFNPLAEISRKSGKSIAELKKIMEQGGISVDMVSAAFDSATSAGGRYAGMLDKLGQTESVRLAKTKAAWEQFAIARGKFVAPIRGLYEDASAYIGMLAADTVRTLDIFQTFDERMRHQMELSDKNSSFIWGDLWGSLEKGSEIVKRARDLDAELAKFSEKNAAFSKLQVTDIKPRYSQDAAKEIRMLEVELGLRSKIRSEIQQKQMELMRSGASQQQIASVVELMHMKDREAFRKQIIELETELGLRNKIVEQRREMMEGGANAGEIRRIEFLKQQVDLMEKQKKISEKHQEAIRNNAEEARRIRRMNFLEQDSDLGVADDLAKAMFQYGAGNMPGDQLTVARRRILENAFPKVSSPSTILAGARANSAEAYQFFVQTQQDANRRQAERQKEQIRVLTIIQDATIEANRLLAEIADVRLGSEG